jgi:4-amino-4-deoxy-L-arabinose transferase-like glycosyltransferase
MAAMTDDTRPDTAARRTLIALIAAAAGLRLIFLADLPPAIFRDEAEKGYNAWCIATTARDLAGHLLPLFINVFGVTTSAIYQYAAVPFVAVLGLNEWSTRLPAALVGLGTIIINYCYMARACGRKPALAATAFLAFSPWHIVFSRWAQQGIFLPLLISGALLAWQLWQAGSRRALPVAAALLGAAMYAYDIARLFVPLLMIGLVASRWRLLARHWRATLTALLAFLVTATPTLFLLITAPAAAQARFSAISIFQETTSALTVARVFASNYLSHFSPGFLLLHGDAELRHSAGVGHLTVIELVCVLTGVALTMFRRGPGERVWIWWLLMAPVAACLTREGVPHALRSIVFIPVIQNLAGVGAAWIFDKIPPARRALALRTGVLAGLLAFLPFAASYFGPYAGRAAINWQYGVKQALDAVEQSDPPVSSVIFYNVTGAEYLVAFYRNIPPAAIQSGDPAWSRYAFPPFNASLTAVCRAHEEAAAFVMLPIFRPPCAEAVISIEAPRRGGTAMAVYFNRAAAATDSGSQP